MATSFPVILLSGEKVKILELPQVGATVMDLRVRLQKQRPLPSGQVYVLFGGSDPISSDQDGMWLSELEEDGAMVAALVTQAAVKPGDRFVYEGEARRVSGMMLAKGMVGSVVEVSSVGDELRVRMPGTGSIIVARSELNFLSDVAEAKLAELEVAEKQLVKAQMKRFDRRGMPSIITAAEEKVAALRNEAKMLMRV